MIKERDYYFDNLKALLIILVVIGHMISPLMGIYNYKFLYNFIYIFHMPLFLFVSGYFSKNLKKENIISKILIPYMVFQTLYGLFSLYILNDNEKFSYFLPYWIMWYLFALFFMQLTLPIITKFKFPLLISFIIGILIGYDSSVGYFASLSRIIVFYPYFLLGFYFDKEKFMKTNIICNKKIISIFLLIIIGAIVYYFTKAIDTRFLYSSYSYKDLGINLYFAGIYRGLLYLTSIVLGFCVLNLVSNSKTVFSKIGKNTLSVYLLHGFIVKLMVLFNFYKYFDNFYKGTLVIILAIITSFILSLEFFNKLINFTQNKTR